jgi:ubiquinone/menaquinone biosynthesis C-methylase UbiE
MAGIMSAVPGFDDEIWETVPEDAGPPPAHIAEFVRSLPQAQRALDLGIGDGRLAAELDALDLTGADTSQVALDRAGKRLPDVRRVLVQPDEPLPFGDNQFDLVLCAETIEHIRDVRLALSEIRRVLRPGGTLALTTPLSSRWRVLVRGVESPFSPHLRAFTRRSLRSTLEAMGFHVVGLEARRGTLLCTAVR